MVTIALIAGATVAGATVGFLVCSALTAGAMADLREKLARKDRELEGLRYIVGELDKVVNTYTRRDAERRRMLREWGRKGAAATNAKRTARELAA